MSKTSKIVLWVVIAVIVAAVIVWFVVPRNSTAPGVQNVPVAGAPGNAPSGLTTAPTDTSDAALNQDLANIDAQLNGLASDSASIDQGLNDQPIPQGQ